MSLKIQNLHIYVAVVYYTTSMSNLHTWGKFGKRSPFSLSLGKSLSRTRSLTFSFSFSIIRRCALSRHNSFKFGKLPIFFSRFVDRCVWLLLAVAFYIMYRIIYQPPIPIPMYNCILHTFMYVRVYHNCLFREYFTFFVWYFFGVFVYFLYYYPQGNVLFIEENSKKNLFQSWIVMLFIWKEDYAFVFQNIIENKTKQKKEEDLLLW